MYQDEKNEYGCPLYFQNGAMTIHNFAAIVEGLPPELRAAFEAERAARRAELEQFLALGAVSNSTRSAASRRRRTEQALVAVRQHRLLKRLSNTNQPQYREAWHLRGSVLMSLHTAAGLAARAVVRVVRAVPPSVSIGSGLPRSAIMASFKHRAAQGFSAANAARSARAACCAARSWASRAAV